MTDYEAGCRAANLANWDERTGIHIQSRFYDLDGWIRDERGPKPWETDALGDVSGLTLVHLQCHIGTDTLAWARAGARVTGVDFSPAAIAAASDLALKAGLDDRATFVCADVYDAASALAGETFDVVYVSLGALCWLPSVDRWAEQVCALVRPGGRVYVHDAHPLAWALADDELVVEHTYFEEGQPFVDDSPRTYTDAEVEISSRRSYEWNHSLGEIVSALIARGLRIDALEELDWTVWRRYPWLDVSPDGRYTVPTGKPRLPLSFMLLATRT